MRTILKRKGWFSVSVTILLITLCACGQKEGPFDTQYLPNGVSRSDYQLFFPSGNQVEDIKVHPPHWWTQMSSNEVQILIYDNEISEGKPIPFDKGVTILGFETTENPNYLLLNIHIPDNCIPGDYPIRIQMENEVRTFSFSINDGTENSPGIAPLKSSDRIYLIMPDRFANGDPENDSFSHLRQTGIDRTKMYFRHGGDLKGIENKLDYIKDLGFTAIWITPVLESDQPYSSYHGYATTDHYKIDPRYGGNDAYKKLSIACENAGIKLIKDVVPNHVGDFHWFVQDIPSYDWIHQSDSYLANNHQHHSTLEANSTQGKIDSFLNGWFDYSMPDLNQDNRLLAKYYIQNSIWWIKEMGIDAYRVDTYGYNNPKYMAVWAKAIKNEFPDFFIFGETWMPDPESQARLFNGQYKFDTLDTKLNGITDFQIADAIKSALLEEPNEENGIKKIEAILSSDSLYYNISQNVLCIDNHDMDRILSILGEDEELMKSALTLLYGIRGIPALYYGTEILHKNFKDPDGKVRADFEGGWNGDKVNKFNKKGRTRSENKIWDHIQRLNSIRENYDIFTPDHIEDISSQNGILKIIYSFSEQELIVLFNQRNRKQRLEYESLSPKNGEIFDLLNLKKIETEITLKSKSCRILVSK